MATLGWNNWLWWCNETYRLGRKIWWTRKHPFEGKKVKGDRKHEKSSHVFGEGFPESKIIVADQLVNDIIGVNGTEAWLRAEYVDGKELSISIVTFEFGSAKQQVLPKRDLLPAFHYAKRRATIKFVTCFTFWQSHIEQTRCQHCRGWIGHKKTATFRCQLRWRSIRSLLCRRRAICKEHNEASRHWQKRSQCGILAKIWLLLPILSHSKNTWWQSFSKIEV